MSVDLDINNYELNDILALFKIPVDFSEADLKNAKKMVLKMHPDKSKLSPDYFRFYSKAYKMLFSIWEFRKKDIANDNPNTEFTNYNDEEKTDLLDNFTKNFKNKTEFNKWFNVQFEKNKLCSETEEKGYSEWLKSDENIDNPKNVTMATMREEFDTRKSKMRSLILKEDIQEFGGGGKMQMGGTELSGDAPETFDSGMFSNLGFQDLYKAHVETLIPVTDEDYNIKPKFKNVNEYVSYRNGQDTNPLSENESMNYIQQKNKKEEEQSVRRAYELAKQTELAQQKNQSFWTNILLLNNKI